MNLATPSSRMRILKSKNMKKIEKILNSYDQRDLSVEGFKMASAVGEQSERNIKVGSN